MMLREIWLRFWRCFRICLRRKCWHHLKNFLHSRFCDFEFSVICFMIGELVSVSLIEAASSCYQSFSSRMAAIDYTVCLHSEVFVTTQGGNFPHFLIGHRRYLYGGHSKTVKPDKRKLALLFDNPTTGYVLLVSIVLVKSD